MYKAKIKVGEKFNKLTALKYVNHRETKKGKVAQWLFKCDCGKECIKDEINVRRNHTKSCSRSCKPYLGKGIALENALYEKYKRTALDRNLEFNITKEELISLSKQNCYYCNISPLQKYYKKDKTEVLLYNGIDRIDNLKGYTKNNCNTCCIRCNTAKNNMSVKDFKDWFHKIINNKCKILFDEF